MPIIKSAIKRVRQQERRQKRNLITKNIYKDLIKKFLDLVDNKKIEDAQKLFPQVQKSIDMAVKKNLLHANTAGRKKSQLMKMISVKKEVASKTPSKKVETKKTEVKKTTKKKTA